jgi:hypothetical protein
MKLFCEVTEFVYSTEPKYGSFLVSYKDGNVDRNLLVKCFVEELKHIKANYAYVRSSVNYPFAKDKWASDFADLCFSKEV